MKYVVYAKFLGSYMPAQRAKIGDCTIAKSHEQFYLDDDRPTIPLRSKTSEFHGLERGVKNYIYYPQRPVSSRTFESEYIIATEVNTYNEREALSIASERFADVSAALSLVAKNKTIKLGKRRVKRADELYDFEIICIFLRTRGQLVRLKLPDPLMNGRNFFPKNLPKGFLAQSKKFLNSRDPVFRKAFIYFQRASAMRYSGVFSQLEILINLVKCIELISFQIANTDRFGLTKKELKKLHTKEIIEKAGKKIGVTSKMVKQAKDFWDVRNKGDVAHQDLYFNPYSKMSVKALVNFNELEAVVSEFLIKYRKYREQASKAQKN